MITIELLEERKANFLQAIRQLEATIAANRGAIEFADHLIALLKEKDGMTEQEFANLIGGNGATSEILPL